jgi:CBS domain-containing protein
MRVEDLMTRDVVSVRPEASLREVAETLVAHRISGVPVCSPDGTVLGVVSEADILLREGGNGRDEARGVLGWIVDWPSPEEIAKTKARTAAEAMTSPALTVAWHRPAAAVARAMIEQGVNRMIVVDGDGKLTGIVTRADLVRAFARSDAEIAVEIRDELLQRTLWAPPGGVDVTVRQGEVALTGRLETKTDVEMLEALVERVPGVVAVQSTVDYRFDDTKRNPRHPREI